MPLSDALDPPFQTALRQIQPPRQRFVADRRPCRHNLTRKSPKYLPISQTRRTFASSIRQNETINQQYKHLKIIRL